MEFTFPDNLTLFNGSLKNFGTNGWFTDIDIQQPNNNVIDLDGISYFYTYLSGTAGNKGGNSLILKLYESQFIDVENIEYGDPELILKISKFKKARFESRSEMRFEQEITALRRCNEMSLQNVVKLFHSGVCKIKNSTRNSYDSYQFYTMEFARTDLKSYIETYHEQLRFDEKLRLCLSLSEGIKELNDLGYYHRDIKPDNIFMIEDEWKIGDLGLVSERDKVDAIDNIGEFIGPRGWLSPEAMNKYLCEGKGFLYNHNCKIDHQSDIFQLGKVFWYIFQYNAPIGSVKEKDFLIKSPTVYSIIKRMLSHSKAKRFANIDEIIYLLNICEEKHFKSLGQLT